MNQSELERRLREGARDWRPVCPDRPRQQVLRRLRTAEATQPGRGGSPLLRPGHRWALAAGMASSLLVLLVLLATPVSRSPRPVDATDGRLSVAAPVVDRVVAQREAALNEEMTRIRTDLQRIRGLIEAV